MRIIKDIIMEIRNSRYKSIMTVFLISFFIFFIITMSFVSTLDSDVKKLAEIKSISSEIQRLVKLELEGNLTENQMMDLDALDSEIYFKQSYLQYFMKNEMVLDSLQNILVDWKEFETSIIEYRSDNDRKKLFLASEVVYYKSASAIEQITLYVYELEAITELLITVLVAHLLIFIFILLRLLIDTNYEIVRTKKLYDMMSIDFSTGLYGRLKCQALLRDTTTPDKLKERAVIVFNIEKKSSKGVSKKTLETFAVNLKTATRVFPFEAFIGRNEGSEFVVCFSSVDEKDINLYIKEVNFLLNKFNREQRKNLKLSYEIGYGITNEETKSLTMGALFDMAIENMCSKKMTV